MKTTLALCFVVLLLAVALPAGQARPGKTFDIYVVDVEGGNATLFVSPSGESLLSDTGNGGAAATRDADRIMAAVADAGLKQIDHLVTTHYHGDHFGAMAEVARRIPIRHFIDHGANVQPNPGTDAFLQKVYPELYAKARHTVVKPGDRIDLGAVDVRVVTSAGQVAQNAHDQPRRNAVFRPGVFLRAHEAAKHGFESHAACGVRLRVEENLGVAQSLRRASLEIGQREIEEVALGPQHAHAPVIEIEEILKLGEPIGAA